MNCLKPTPGSKDARQFVSKQICRKTEGEAIKFQSAYEGSKLKKLWKCETCDHWHFDSTPRGPAGGSSGTQRENNLPKDFVPFLREKTKREIEQRRQQEAARTIKNFSVGTGVENGKPAQDLDASELLHADWNNTKR